MCTDWRTGEALCILYTKTQMLRTLSLTSFKPEPPTCSSEKWTLRGASETDGYTLCLGDCNFCKSIKTLSIAIGVEEDAVGTDCCSRRRALVVELLTGLESIGLKGSIIRLLALPLTLLTDRWAFELLDWGKRHGGGGGGLLSSSMLLSAVPKGADCAMIDSRRLLAVVKWIFSALESAESGGSGSQEPPKKLVVGRL